MYRGVFGSHVANVLRRLRRLARIYGSEPQFLLASATIANPGGLARSLLGLDVTVIADDAAPRAERTVCLWNPPLLDEELGQRASALGEGARLLAELVSRDLRTLVFAKSRKSAELIHRFALDRLGSEYAGRLSPYRAGYTPLSGVRSSRSWWKASCSESPPPTPSSWASTSACSTAWSPSASRAQSRQPAAAVGARRPSRTRAGGARSLGRRTRPVLHARAGDAARPARRGRHPRSCQPSSPGRARARGCVRGAYRRSRPHDAR